MVTFLFSVSNRQGGARAVDLPAKSFDLARPGSGITTSATTTTIFIIFYHLTLGKIFLNEFRN